MGDNGSVNPTFRGRFAFGTFILVFGLISVWAALTLSTEAQRQGIDSVQVSETLRPLLHTETRRCIAAILRSAGHADIVDLATLMVLAAANYAPFLDRIGEQAA